MDRIEGVNSRGAYPFSSNSTTITYQGVLGNSPEKCGIMSSEVSEIEQEQSFHIF